jgi:hypothetical protein
MLHLQIEIDKIELRFYLQTKPRPNEFTKQIRR